MTLISVAVLAAGCTSPGSSDADSGDFELLVSDRPANISDFDYLNVSFSEARIFQDENGSENFTVTELDGNRSVDLTQVQGARAKSMVNTTLETGNYTKIELYSSDITASVNGTPTDVKIPPGKLMITKPFTVEPNTTTRFVFDIQVVLRGNAQNNQGYILKPVISESGVAGEDVEVERGSANRAN